ncbi:MAG TPA: tetratricopeptide repeat protein [Candidatus Acidoferrum sp.]|nr:tetratricopeptide repeat protein [Candidatus Acidoferrum sp.]
MESDAVHLPLAHQAWAWFEANRKPALVGAGAILVIAAVVSFYYYQQDEKNQAAAEALSAVEVPQMGGGRAGTDQAAAYLSVARQYAGTGAGARALLLGAGSLFTEGKYSESKTEFDRFVRDYSDSPLMGEALLGSAACLDAMGKTNEALNAYETIVRQHSTENVASQARFALGRLYEARNEPEKARDQFEEVARANPYGSLGSEAGMRVEELNLKYPKLVPMTPMPTNTPPMTIETGK